MKAKRTRPGRYEDGRLFIPHTTLSQRVYNATHMCTCSNKMWFQKGNLWFTKVLLKQYMARNRLLLVTETTDCSLKGKFIENIENASHINLRVLHPQCM